MMTRISPDLINKMEDEYHYTIIKRALSLHGGGNVENFMQDQLYKEFAIFLKQLTTVLRGANIHPDCGIMNDYLFAIFDLNKNELTSNQAFECIPFNLNHEWDFRLDDLMPYFNIHIDYPLAYVSLQSKEALTEIILRLQPWLQSLPVHIIDQYQLKSMYILENHALEESMSLSKEVMILLNGKMQTQTMLPIEKTIFPLVLQIYSLCEIQGTADNKPNLCLMKLTEQLREQCEHFNAYKQLNWLLKHLDDYIYFNKQYSELTAMIREDLQTFFNPYQISISKSASIEETLLIAAGVAIPSKLRCLLKLPYGEPQRVRLFFNGLSLQEANQLKTFLNQFDNTGELHEGEYRSGGIFPPKNWPRGDYSTMNIILNPKAFYQIICPIYQTAFLERLKQKDQRIELYRIDSREAFSEIQKEPNENQVASYDPGFFAHPAANRNALNDNDVSIAKVTERPGVML